MYCTFERATYKHHQCYRAQIHYINKSNNHTESKYESDGPVFPSEKQKCYVSNETILSADTYVKAVLTSVAYF